MVPNLSPLRILTAAAALAIGGVAAEATDVLVSTEATVQGGVSAELNVDEAAAGYVHVKYYAGLDLARKAYFQFDLAGHAPDIEASAAFTVNFTVSNRQRVQLWALNQAYPGFNADISWNTAHANDLASNQMLGQGPFTASAVGENVLIPTSGTTPYTFAIPRLGNVLVSNQVTLVIAGVEDALNNSGGLRVRRTNAVLSFSPADGEPPPATNAVHYDVYLAAGQSNMDGRGSTNDLVGNLGIWNQVQTDVRIYYANPVNLDPINPTYNTGWQALAPGFSVPPGFSGALPSTRFGPALAFARTVADATSGRMVAVIKVSKGGTSLSSDWKPGTGYMYSTLTNIARLALGSLTNAGASYTLRGMIWHQGESDGSSSTATYQARLTEFIGAVRQDFGVGNLPFVVGELATNRSVTVRQAQINVSQTVPYVGFASSSNLATLAPDDPHFTSAGALIMGQRMAAALEIPPIQLLSAQGSNGNLVLTASGLARSSCFLLASTNLTLPEPQWRVASTNVFTSNGEITLSLPIPADNQAEFFMLKGD